MAGQSLVTWRIPIKEMTYRQLLPLTSGLEFVKDGGDLEIFECDPASVNAHLAVLAHIQGRIINEAKNLLDITGMNVSEISNTLGFHTTNYFIRFFKKHTGVTPGDYRNKAQ